MKIIRYILGGVGTVLLGAAALTIVFLLAMYPDAVAFIILGVVIVGAFIIGGRWNVRRGHQKDIKKIMSLKQ